MAGKDEIEEEPNKLATSQGSNKSSAANDPQLNPSFMQLFSYKLDNLMTWNPLAKVFLLLLCTVIVIITGGIAFHIVQDVTPANGPSPGILRSIWQAWTYVADPGTHADLEGTWERAAGLFLTLGGMLFFALLVGLIADGISSTVDELQKGKSRVIETDHTLILGWSSKILSLIEQTAEANSSEGGGVIVILADKDKQEMEIEIMEGISDLKGTRVVCRSGSAVLVSDLKKVAALHARSIVVLGTDNYLDEQSDAETVRIVLALCRGLGVTKAHVVVELFDENSVELISIVGENRTEVVCAHNMVGRLMIQCARQPGLAQVYPALLGFEGNEFYLDKWPNLTGVTFGEAIYRFKDAVPCGIKKCATGKVILNPPDAHVVESGDEILVLAEDNDTYEAADAPVTKASTFSSVPEIADVTTTEQILFCGWRTGVQDMIKELDNFVTRACKLTILSQVPIEDRKVQLEGTEIQNLAIEHKIGSPTSRRHLEQLDIKIYDAILVLSSSDYPSSISDSHCLMSLLLIRQLQNEAGCTSTLISEICDPRTKSLVSVANVSDYVVSNELVSMALAQVAESREINGVLTEIFSADGQEIYLRKISCYVEANTPTNFWDIQHIARLRKEIALGYKKHDGEVVLNPPDKNKVITWNKGDCIVVLSED